MTDTEAQTVRSSTPEYPVGLILFGVILALVLGLLDNMIIGTAMPSIVRDLGGVEHLSWVVTAYTLATAVTTPVWGKIGDLFGRRHVYLAAIALFLIGSALSGAAQNVGELIGFRVLQGCGSGGLVVGAFAIIGDLAAPRERGRYQSMFATLMVLATIAGPLAGGFITDHAGWRWTFYINIPIGLVAFVWCAITLRLPRRRGSTQIDLVGAALLAVAVTATLLICTWGGSEYAWGSIQIGALAAAALTSLGLFLWWETRVAEPILPLRLFRSRNLAIASGMGLLFGAIMFGSNTYIPLYQQTVEGASASNSGILLLPMMLGSATVSQISARFISRTGRYRPLPIVGFALMAIAMLLLSTISADTSRIVVTLYMVLLGVGMGSMVQMTTLLAQNSVSQADLGVASASATLFRTIGGSMGVALFGALLNSQMAGNDDITSSAYRSGMVSGINDLFLCGAGIAAAGFLAAWFVMDVPLRESVEEGERS